MTQAKKTPDFQRVLGEVYAALNGARKTIETDINLFREVYAGIVERDLIEDRELFGIVYGDGAVLWFPAAPNIEFRIAADRALSAPDFSFVLRSHIVGATTGRYTIWRFLWDEIRNLRAIGSAWIAAVTAAVLYFGTPEYRWDDVIAATIPAVALFTSLFVLFAISQRSFDRSNVALMKSPIFYRYSQVDRYVAWVLSLGLLSGLLSLVATTVSKDWLGRWVGSAEFEVMTFAITIFSISWAIMALVAYYFERSTVVQNAIGVPLLRERMQDEYESANQTGEPQ